MSARPFALVLNPVKVGDADGLAERLRERCRAAGLPDPLVLETTDDDPGRVRPNRPSRPARLPSWRPAGTARCGWSPTR
jgi:hypothetical protein